LLMPPHLFLSLTRTPPTSTLFPYTTLFRSRAEQDAFALESQRRAERALKDCVFTDELVPVPLPDGTTFSKDEYPRLGTTLEAVADRKSTRLNSSHVSISYAVFCLKKKTK